MSLEDVLLNSLQGNANAELQLESMLSDLNVGVKSICDLLHANKSDQLTSGCMLLIKRICDKRSREYLAVDSHIRNQLHIVLLELLESQMAPNAISAISALEGDHWQVVPILMQIIQSPNSENKKANALNCIGYICECVDPIFLQNFANPILTAVIYGANQDSNKIKRASINALNNSLVFIKGNFSVEGERNYIMETVCTCCIYKDPAVRAVAFECLVKIVTLYYEFMEPYMKSALIGLTTAAMQFGVTHQDEQVTLQAIEFWSSICDEELNILEFQDKQNLNFSGQYMKQIIPILLWLLTNCEHVDKDEWCIYTSAVTCLTLYSQLLGDDVANEVVPFIEQNINADDWKCKQAAVTAFGCILDGPKPEYIGHIVNGALPIVVGLINESALTETCMWVIGLICNKILPFVYQNHYPLILQALHNGLMMDEGVKLFSCIGLSLFIKHNPPISSEIIKQTGPLLITMSGMPIPNETSRLRRAATETLEYFIKYSPELEFVNQVGSMALQSFNAACQLIIQMDSIEEHLENMGCLIERVIARLGPSVPIELIDQVMQSLMMAFGKIPEDCFRIMGTIVLTNDFNRYLGHLQEHLNQALKQVNSPSLLRNAIYLLSDVSKMNSQFILGYIEPLFQLLQNTEVDKHVKPVILTCLGDIAATMGNRFEPYLSNIASILQAAMSVDEDVDFTLELRQATADCLTELLWAMREQRMSILI